MRQFDPALPELMDRPQPVTRELERDLANLRSFNHWFGSHRLVRHFLRRWLKPNGKVRVLDVATGSGDIPRLIVDHARRQNISVHIDAIDLQESTIEIAGTKNLPLVAKRFGSNRHPEHSRWIPLRYLKDSITGSLDCARDDRLSSENHRDSGCGPGTCVRTSGQIRTRADDGCVAPRTSGVDSCRA